MAESKDQEPQVRVVDRRWWARDEAGEAADAAARKPTYVEELERQLADNNARMQELIGEHRRAQEEFEQARTRIRRDIGREVERGKRAILTELLEVVDNLDRAVAAAADQASPDEAALERLVRGVELVRDQFLAKLLTFGVTRVAVLGETFDATRHEAVTTTPVTDAAADGMVVAVIKEGYAIGDEVLRPASVVVGKR